MNPAFRAWFGHSVVRNADGSPKRVYHGTRATFLAFDLTRAGTGAGKGDVHYVEGAAWFGEHPETANYFGDRRDGGQVLPVYLRIENPLVVDAEAWARRYGVTGDSFRIDASTRVYDIRFFKRRAVEDARAAGHDGVVFTGGYDGPPVVGDIYVVFDPRQVKSAIGGPARPAWSREDPRLLHGLRFLR